MKIPVCKCWNSEFQMRMPAIIVQLISWDNLNWFTKNWDITDWPRSSKVWLRRCNKCLTKYPNQKELTDLEHSIN